MLITRRLYLLIITLSLVSVVYAQRNISLEEALAIQSKNSPALQAINEELNQVEYNKKDAVGKFLPVVDFEASVTRIDDEIMIDLNDIRTAMFAIEQQNLQMMSMTNPMIDPTQVMAGLDAAIPSFETQVQDKQFYNMSLKATWPIFTGGRLISNYSASKQEIKSINHKKKLESQKIQKTLIERYLALEMTTMVRELNDSLLMVVTNHAEQAESLNKHGMISYAELLRAKVALSDAKKQSREALRNQELSQKALQSTLQMEEEITTTTKLFYIENIPTLEQWQSMSKNHPGLRYLESEKKRSKIGVNASRGNFFPTVALFGKTELYRGDLTILEPDWAVGAVLQYRIFDGFNNVQKYKKAKSVNRQVDRTFVQTKNDVNLLIEKLYRELEVALDEYSFMEDAEKLARESLRAQNLAFSEGISTSLGVISAQQSLLKVQVGKLKALYDLDKSYVDLLEIAGKIEDITNVLKTEL